MSLIRIIVTDKDTVITGEIHGSLGDPLVASLTAEPETIEELELALRRFVENDSDYPIGKWFRRTGLNDPLDFLYAMDLEPYDAGILIVDLAARIIANESTYTLYSREGTIDITDRLSNGEEPAKFALPYQISDDWKFVCDALEYEVIAKERRRELLAAKPQDSRSILYGEPLHRFIAEELSRSQIPENEQLHAHLHALWLMKERPDLNGKSPREILLEKREYIDFDLHSRSLQYSFSTICPPDLSMESRAYKFAGFGIHENVIYYDMIRHLLDRYYQRLLSHSEESVDTAVGFLKKEQESWLNRPNPEFSGRSPASIVESERCRRNLTMSPHECIIDEDCPICVEMSQMFDTPMFWHLDGSHMDQKFAFSFYQTYEEWQEEELAFEAYMKRELRQSGFDDLDEEFPPMIAGSSA
jgi:hypothetical protein